MSTVILPPTNLVVTGPQVWSSVTPFSSVLPITCTQTNDLVNTPINSAAWVWLLGSADGGATWVPFAQRTFTLDDPIDAQTFEAKAILRYSTAVYSQATLWYEGQQAFTANWPLSKSFQAPWTHLILLFNPPQGDTPGLSVSVTATQG